MLTLLPFIGFLIVQAENDTDLYRSFPAANQDVPLVRLTRHLLSPDNYDIRVRPIMNNSESLKIHISMSLYQIIEVNEPAQNIKMNKWVDELLDWDPHEYAMINTTILPFDSLWIPDTYLYNSVVMNRDETERYMNIQVETRYWQGKRGAQLSFLYPAIYTITCRLNIRYFPYDQQNCTLTISSWTNSKSALDYYADDKVNLASFIQNEEWDVISFKIYRHEYKYACCPEPWVILEASLIIRRKPLYYIVNLIIPTSIITIVSITGFFTPASTNDDRTEKINLGITTLLAMSILMLMVSDQMPTTSEFVPLIAWFYLSIIILISIGTFLTSIVLSVQGRRQYGRMPSLCIRRFFLCMLNRWLFIEQPPQLTKLWKELNDHPWTKRKKKNQKVPVDRKAAAIQNDNRTDKEERRRSDQPNRLEVSEPLVKTGGTMPPRPSVSSATGGVATGATAKKIGSKLRAGTPPNPMLLSSIEAVDRRLSGASFKMIDSPTTPTSLLNLRRDTRNNSLWDSALMLVSVGDEGNLGMRPMSLDVVIMKRKRQCALEWEFLATVLDRLLLILFTFAVIFVTAGMIFTGMQAQAHYDSLLDTH